MLTTQVCQMRPFLVVCKMCANTLCHHHYKRPIIHIHPVRAAHKLAVAVTYKRTIGIAG
jgi:hypothetical protein